MMFATLLVALFFAFASWLQHSIVGRTQYSRRIETHIESMAGRCPNDLTAAQWRTMVDWTRNLHANSLLPFQTNLREIREFETRIGDRLKGSIDAGTIEWLWDQYAEVCQGGADYQRFRLQVNAELTAHNSPVLLEPPTLDRDNRG